MDEWMSKHKTAKKLNQPWKRVNRAGLACCGQRWIDHVKDIKGSFQQMLDDLNNSVKVLRKQSPQSCWIESPLESSTLKLMKSMRTLLKTSPRRQRLLKLKLKATLLAYRSVCRRPTQGRVGINPSLHAEPAWHQPDAWTRQTSQEPSLSEPPRPYVTRLLSSTDWQLLLRAARSRKKLSWRGKPFHVCQDLPMEIYRRRAENGDVKKKELRAAGICYTAFCTLRGSLLQRREWNTSRNHLRRHPKIWKHAASCLRLDNEDWRIVRCTFVICQPVRLQFSGFRLCYGFLTAGPSPW